MNDAIKRVMKYSYLIGAVIAGIFLLRKEVSWASGFMVGIIWCVLNFIFTVRLFEVALLRKEAKRISMSLVIKFPVLYLIGFFILVSKAFPVMSILTGVGLALLVIGVVNIWPKRA